MCSSVIFLKIVDALDIINIFLSYILFAKYAIGNIFQQIQDIASILI